MTKNEKVHAIIHSTSATAAAIGAGLAQLPGSDAPALVALQSAMIVTIANVHGESITKSAATVLVADFAATMVGRGISQWVVGWIPLYGNAINASTAAAVTETIGWAADTFFDKEEKKKNAA